MKMKLTAVLFISFVFYIRLCLAFAPTFSTDKSLLEELINEETKGEKFKVEETKIEESKVEKSDVEESKVEKSDVEVSKSEETQEVVDRTSFGPHYCSLTSSLGDSSNGCKKYCAEEFSAVGQCHGFLCHCLGNTGK